MFTVRRFMFFFAAFAFLTGNALAQETIHFGSVAGIVTDSSGALIAKAKVSARKLNTDISTQTLTDSNGRFRFSYLMPGDYRIEFTAPGFTQVSKQVNVTVGSSYGIVATLTVGMDRRTITVDDRPPILETSKTQISGTVSQTEIANIPLNGRNILDLALFVPGVSPTNTGSTQLFAETSAVPGQGVSVGGQRNFSNNFILDGLSANDDAAGLIGTSYSADALQELQVVTTGGQTEFGRALGGYINMVSKSGTNSFHADLYGYFRNRRLNAANPLSGTVLPLTQTQYGVSLGGPISRGRTFFFANFEQKLLNQSGFTSVPQSIVDSINSILNSVGKGSTVVTGAYSNPVHSTTALGKIDHTLSPKDNFSVRYSSYEVSSSNSRGAGGLSTISAATALESLDQAIAMGNVHTFSSRLINESRAQFTNSDLQAPPNDAVGPAVTISGVASLGTASGSPTARHNRSLEAVDNISYQAGPHSLRAGADFLFNDLTITYPRAVRGSYSFTSLANFQQGSYSTFTQTIGDPKISQQNPNVGFYFQDEWRIGRAFTLDAGLRYDLQFLDTISTDTDNLAPRLGLAWSPTQRTVVRATGGLFYDRVPMRALANALLSSHNSTVLGLVQQQNITLSFGQFGAPVFPGLLASVPQNTLISLTTEDRHLPNAYSVQFGLEVEQQLTKSSTVSVNYQHLRGIHLLASINQNVPACSSVVDPSNLCRANPKFQNNSQYSGVGDSIYDALNILVSQRPTRFGAIKVAYTFSKALDDVGEFFFSSPLNVFNIHQDWGRSDDDQNHRVVLDGYLQLPKTSAKSAWQHVIHNFQLGGTFQYYSALPLNVISGVTTVQQSPGRPCYGLPATSSQCTISAMIGRNAGTGFNFVNVNARLSRTIKISEICNLQMIAETFNLFNHRNNMIPNGTFGPAVFPVSPRSTFGQPTAVGDPRSIQLALRLKF